ncbi:hypothetical protein [Actinopolymorpha alba]|nr:hypothetical protein [Actinopolymorpha alba]
MTARFLGDPAAGDPLPPLPRSALPEGSWRADVAALRHLLADPEALLPDF